MGAMSDTLRDELDSELSSIIGTPYDDLAGAVKDGVFTAIGNSLETHVGLFAGGGPVTIPVPVNQGGTGQTALSSVPHSSWGTLGWGSSGHTGTANALASFDGSGNASTTLTSTFAAAAHSHATLPSALPVPASEGGTGQTALSSVAHSSWGSLGWTSSGHTGAANALAGFNVTGQPTTVATSTFAAAAHSHADVIAAGASGFMPGSDKAKLNGIATGANLYVHPNHSGDVTSTADGATVIVANAVSNTQLEDMATLRVKGRVTAGTGDPEDLTASQVAGLLDHDQIGNNLDWANTGHTGTADNFAIFSPTGQPSFLAAAAVSYAGHSHAAVVAGGASGFMIGTDKAKLDLFTAPYAHPNHTGDVSSTGDGVTVIGNGKVTNAQLANVATDTFKGRDAAGTGSPEDLTVAAAQAMLGVFSPGYLSITVNASSTLSAGKIDAFANGSYAAPSFISDVTASNASHTASTGLMTATNAGTYRVTLTMVMDAASASNVSFTVERNSIGVFAATARVNTTNTIVTYSFLTTMTAGQYLEVFFDSLASNVQCKAGTNFNFHRIA